MNEPKITITGRRITFSEATRKLNPQLFAVGGVEAAKPEQKGPLEPVSPHPEKRPEGLRYRVCLVAFLRRRHDSDNLIGGFKPLRDAIATHLGVDDSDAIIEWAYAQCQTRGAEGTAVKIEVL